MSTLAAEADAAHSPSVTFEAAPAKPGKIPPAVEVGLTVEDDGRGFTIEDAAS
ncbi:MAG TPA: hypothetical protein VEW48_19765 [Thermoanaerobaculia bacterium]|nr:hypothetical protein [Thermoanaerobaculia bacterium]